jgi:hypothetical protein
MATCVLLQHRITEAASSVPRAFSNIVPMCSLFGKRAGVLRRPYRSSGRSAAIGEVLSKGRDPRGSEACPESLTNGSRPGDLAGEHSRRFPHTADRPFDAPLPLPLPSSRAG